MQPAEDSYVGLEISSSMDKHWIDFILDSNQQVAEFFVSSLLEFRVQCDEFNDQSKLSDFVFNFLESNQDYSIDKMLEVG